MITLAVKGQLTSKRAAHVPVIRRWKLIWERREFGTQVDQIDLAQPIPYSDLAQLPPGGLVVKLPADFMLHINSDPDSSEPGSYVLVVAHKYVPVILGTYKFTVPTSGKVVLLDVNTQLYKGVKAEFELSLNWSI